MSASADSSVGDMQAAARAEQSGAEQADCWNQWPSKTTAGRIRVLPEGGERGITVSQCLPRLCAYAQPRGGGWCSGGGDGGDVTISSLFLF